MTSSSRMRGDILFDCLAFLVLPEVLADRERKTNTIWKHDSSAGFRK